MTRKSCLLLAAFAAGLFALSGCGEEIAPPPHDHQPEFEVALCGLCGDLKEEGHTCKEGATICSICGLHKGSILCCSTAFTGSPREVILCSKCGEVAFGAKCCKPGPALCPKCGLHRGSPGCCKIEKEMDDGSGHAVEQAGQGGPNGHAG
jgi:hypothetical protein